MISIYTGTVTHVSPAREYMQSLLIVIAQSRLLLNIVQCSSLAIANVASDQAITRYEREDYIVLLSPLVTLCHK